MNNREYFDFIDRLNNTLEKKEEVLSLIALGSMSDRDYSPDEFSDHDFWIVVKEGSEEYYRKNIEWIPDNQNIALFFRETEHGVKVVYNNGHLLEYAVFKKKELVLTKLNRYRVYFDKAQISNVLNSILMESENTGKVQDYSDEYLIGQIFTNLLVANGRYKRGEKLSSQFFVKNSAITNLIILICKHRRSEKEFLLDNLNLTRRIEFVYPEFSDIISKIQNSDIPESINTMIDFIESEFKYLFTVEQSLMIEILKKESE